jgi:hypothetical protein
MPEIKRPNYFNNQFLLERDFNDEQSYHEQKRRLHNRRLHAWGVADGFTVLRADANRVAISAGTALDNLGREIIFDAGSHTLVTAGSNIDVYLTIAFREVQDPADHYTEGGVDNYTRFTERPIVADSPTPPPADGSVILLARIRLDQGGAIDLANPIDENVRTLAGAKIAPRSIRATHLADEAQPTASRVDNLGGTNRIVAQINAGSGLIAHARVEAAPEDRVSGVVFFPTLTLGNEQFSADINPGLGPGPLLVQLGVDNHPTPGFTTSGDNDYGRLVRLRSVIQQAVGTFRVFVTSISPNVPSARIRWYAFKLRDTPETIATVGIALTPTDVSMPSGTNSQAFTSSITGSTEQRVTWRVVESNGGSIAPSSTTVTATYTPPNATGTYHVEAKSNADPSKVMVATILRNVPVTVSVSPASHSMLTTQTVDIDAAVTSNSGVTWSVQESNGGSVATVNSLKGRYTPPSASGTYHVRATSIADPTKSATCTVNVTNLSITVDADDTSINTNTSTTVRATINWSANRNANWAVTAGGSGGSVSPATGQTTAFTATAPGTYTIRGRSVADSSKQDTVTVTVTTPKTSEGGGGGGGKLMANDENFAPPETRSLPPSTRVTAAKPKAAATARTFIDPSKRPK